MLDFDLIIKHLQLAIMLGAIASGIVETLKEWIFPDLAGRKLTITSVILTAIISFVIGYFYTDATTIELVASTVWGVVGAQAVYATVQTLNKDVNFK